MAVAQPQTNDGLNNPDHAKLHRVLGIDTNAADKSVVVDSQGNIGVNNTNPASALDVSGTGSMQAISVGGSTISDFTGSNLSVSSGTLNASGGSSSAGNSGAVQRSDGNNGLVGSVNELYVDSNTKYVGVATSSPGAPLHIKESDTNLLRLQDPNTDIANGNYDQSVLEWRDSQGARDWFMGRNNQGHFTIRDTQNNNIVMKAKRDGDMIFEHGGRVGIRETNPQNALDVVGDVTFTGNLRGNGMDQLDNESMTFKSGTRHICLKISDDSATGLLNFFDSNENEFARLVARNVSGTGDGDVTFEKLDGLGVGKESAAKMLDVAGDIAVSGVVDGTDLTNVSEDTQSDAHHSKTSSASELSDVSADSVGDAHHSKTSSASELSDVSPDSDASAHHQRYSDSEARAAVDLPTITPGTSQITMGDTEEHTLWRGTAPSGVNFEFLAGSVSNDSGNSPTGLKVVLENVTQSTETDVLTSTYTNSTNTVSVSGGDDIIIKVVNRTGATQSTQADVNARFA